MKKLGSVTIMTFSLLLVAVCAFAQTNDTKPLTVNFAIAARAKLTLGVAAINFPDKDPDTDPTVYAAENPVSVTAKVRTGAASVATLTHKASADLTSGTITIPIGNVSWTVGGNGFVAGTMNKTTAQTAGSWTGSGDRSSTFTFALVNSWSYATGTYTASSTYTLSAP